MKQLLYLPIYFFLTICYQRHLISPSNSKKSYMILVPIRVNKNPHEMCANYYSTEIIQFETSYIFKKKLKGSTQTGHRETTGKQKTFSGRKIYCICTLSLIVMFILLYMQ